ncbi:DeoR/GlpR family DNA-binding transcription regulator [Aestuariivirga sp.]|uniref:DeoR/GlpR family DNA-binding transcription regulator n=1 Tax=Aestuariivirga sp. TaxID=2650926 RepID=UPI0025C624DD|nr:DeoR/GlpR family DNA-binding transcription regulator [Aestuariivirga sp.]MCA3554798.1 DeoR/GlpR transcriptional regulator [Aestuariivirga sp.]
MTEAERHKLMLDLLRDRPFASVRDLQAVIDASPATIRRDVAKLHAAGSVRKVFGGIAATEAGGPEGVTARPFTENQMLGVAAKKAIAREAASLVQDGDALIIHGGSTCYLFALLLASRSVRIYTNSMPLAATLWQNGACHLTLAGGELYREPAIVHSPQAGPPDFYASKFFLGAQAIAPAGMQESHPLVARETALLLERADEVIVLADSRKFGMRARNHIMPLSRIGTLITDDNLTDANHKMLMDAGIRVIIARASPDFS